MLLACLSLPCLGQFSSTLSPGVPVQPGVSDVGPLATSLRVVPLDLRQESDFSRVYQIDRERFARQAGGLIAIFPRSVYIATPSGVVADIPPGTIFQIGALPAPEPLPEPSPLARVMQVDRRMPTREADPRRAGSGPQGDEPGTSATPRRQLEPDIWQDDAARRASIARLLGRENARSRGAD